MKLRENEKNFMRTRKLSFGLLIIMILRIITINIDLLVINNDSYVLIEVQCSLQCSLFSRKFTITNIVSKLFSPFDEMNGDR
jgi:hypothetical protein